MFNTVIHDRKTENKVYSVKCVRSRSFENSVEVKKKKNKH